MDSSQISTIISNSLEETYKSCNQSFIDAFKPLHDACQMHVFRTYLERAKENKVIPVFSIVEDLNNIEYSIENPAHNVRLFLASVEKEILVNNDMQFTDRQKYLLASAFTSDAAKLSLTECAIKHKFNWHSVKET